MSLEAARELFDVLPEDYEELGNAIDHAQGEVITGRTSAAFVVIRITR